MVKSAGLAAGFTVGTVNLSCDVAEIGALRGGPAPIDVTALCNEAFERIGGQRDSEISFTSHFNPDVGASHPTLAALPTTDVQVVYMDRSTIGNAVAVHIAKQINYDGERDSDGKMTFEVESLGNGFGLEWGRMGTPGVATSSGAENLTGYDDETAAATDFGLQAYLTVTAFSGTSAAITLEDSNDDGGGDAYALIPGAAFTSVTGVTTERIATSVTENVKEWVRVAITGTYSDLQFVVVWVRNYTAPSF